MATSLIISPAARDDLRAIFEFSLETWGRQRAEDYLDELSQHIYSLLAAPRLGISRDDILPGLRSTRVARHVVFYRIEQERVEVLRVLSERQDSSVLAPS